MLYLEDFLEKLELLPQEIINQTSEIRQLDQQVKDSMDCMKKNLDNLFSNANTMHPDDLYADFNTVMKVGNKVLKQSDDKIQIANNMQKLVGKYINHVDVEIQNFKMDLDDEKIGSTELIENNNKVYVTVSELIEIENVLHNDSSFVEQLTVDSNCSDTGSLELQMDTVLANSQMDPSYTLEHGASSSNNSAAASKIKVNTKKKIKSCRRVSSEESTKGIECNKTNLLPVALLPEPIDRKLSQSGGSNKNKIKKRTKNLKQEKTDDSLDMSTDEDKIELNDRRYCICNEIAYGEMIACDNKKCPLEWFHYGCVGVQNAPTGKWYCPECVVKLKKKRQ